jgi:uncharacterized protein
VNKKVTVTGANLVFLIYIVVTLVFQIVLSSVYSNKFIEQNMYWILLFNELVVILLPAVLYVGIKKQSFKQVFRFNRLGVTPALIIAAISVPAYFVAMALNSLVIYWLELIGNIPPQALPVPRNLNDLLIGVLVISVSPAVCEEILHRGLILKAYEKRGSMKAVVVTAAFFGLFHLDPTNLLGPIFLGILIGYYVIRTNSIFAGMLAHFLNNTIALILQYFLNSSDTNAGGEEFPLASLVFICILGLIGFVITFNLLKGFKRKTEQRSIMLPSITSIDKDFHAILTHWPVIVSIAVYIVTTGFYIVYIITGMN